MDKSGKCSVEIFRMFGYVTKKTASNFPPEGSRNKNDHNVEKICPIFILLLTTSYL